jgi:hypothetical protein
LIVFLSSRFCGVCAPHVHRPKYTINQTNQKKGGRLVFFLPSSPETYREDELPEHPALELVANSEQALTGRYSRRLLTMVKVTAFDAGADAEWREARRGVVLAIERVADIVWAPAGGLGGEGGGGGEGGRGMFAGKHL